MTEVSDTQKEAIKCMKGVIQREKQLRGDMEYSKVANYAGEQSLSRVTMEVGSGNRSIRMMPLLRWQSSSSTYPNQ